VPINALVPLKEPDGRRKPVEIWEMIRMVATSRIIMPETQVRLSAGRMNMSRRSGVLLLVQILFCRDKLLTTQNPDVNEDMKMFEMLGLNPQNHLLKFLNQQQLKQRILSLLHLVKNLNGRVQVTIEKP
jgi:biotin synthase